jgi:hypothetical protein
MAGTSLSTQGGVPSQKYSTQRPFSPEDLSQPLYDRVRYPAAGAQELSFFSAQKGQQATLGLNGTSQAKAKSYRDTNMDNGGVVPTKRYTFVGMAINYIPVQQAFGNALTPGICDDMLRLKNGGYLEFRIVDKPLLYLPLNQVPESQPIAAVSTTANNATIIGSGVIAAIPFPMYKFAIPITLNPYENFSFVLRFDGTQTVTQDYDIQVVLHAFMRRPS